MPTTLWKKIDPADQPMCDQFVAMMHLMDPRYRAFASDQLQQWLTGVEGPYVGDVVAAFGWFPQATDMSIATRMQIVLLGRYKPGTPTADLLMLGWTPTNHETQPTYLDKIIDEILAKGVEWLGTLTSSTPVKALVTNRPATMGREQVKRLHDRFYARATADPAPTGPYLQLIRERAGKLGSTWQLQLIA